MLHCMKSVMSTEHCPSPLLGYAALLQISGSTSSNCQEFPMLNKMSMNDQGPKSGVIESAVNESMATSSTDKA